MKKIIVTLLVLVCVFTLFASAQKEDKLVVYCYDSFTGDWGAGNSIVQAFKEKTGIDVELVGCGGAVETYTKVLYEGSDCRADVVLGLSDEIKVDEGLFEDYKAFDYGIFAFIRDTESNSIVPKSLEDLAKPEFKGMTILIDPRTSSVGLGLLKWTVEAFGEEKALQWWKDMKSNCLTMASSWSGAYGLFTENEAPLVISYTTSPVYHVLYEDSTRYQAIEFSEGHVGTTEYMGTLKTSKHKDWAKLFEDFVLNEGQADIAIANTMFPANEDTVLPDAFNWALKPKMIEEKTNFTDTKDSILDRWTLALAQ